MLLAGFAIAAGCGPSGGRGPIPKIAELTEAEKTPVYRVTIGDETEAMLLADHARLAVVALDGAEATVSVSGGLRPLVGGDPEIVGNGYAYRVVKRCDC